MDKLDFSTACDILGLADVQLPSNERDALIASVRKWVVMYGEEHVRTKRGSFLANLQAMRLIRTGTA